MSEPDFISQNGDTTPEESRAWFRLRAEEAAAKGATWHRFSHHADTGTILYEGWLKRPKNEGPVRWMFTAEEPRP